MLQRIGLGERGFEPIGAQHQGALESCRRIVKIAQHMGGRAVSQGRVGVVRRQIFGFRKPVARVGVAVEIEARGPAIARGNGALRVRLRHALEQRQSFDHTALARMVDGLAFERGDVDFGHNRRYRADRILSSNRVGFARPGR